MEDRKRRNVRTLLILGSIALAFFAGFVAKTWLFGF
ncbi:cytochrome oxidase small assembly protein [Uliginosibacterium silvisoli]